MNFQQISDIFSQLKKLDKNNLQDTDKYKQIYEQIRHFGQFPIKEGNDQYELSENNMKDALSESQIYQIRQQILAYKMLIRNMNIPKEVERNLSGLTKEQWEAEKEKLYQRTLRYYNEKVEKDEDLKRLIQQKYNTKKTAPLPPPNGATPNGQQGDMPPLPSAQVDFVNESTVKYIEKNSYFVDRRKHEIQLLLTSGYLAEEARVKTQAELKFLEQLPFYFQLRDTVLAETKASSKPPNRAFEKMFLDRKYFTREKPARKGESKMMEKFELHIRNEQDQKKKVRHREFLQQLYGHQAEFFEYHKKRAKNLKKRTQHVKNYLELAEKKRQEKNEKEMKKRVEMIKLNDMEGYRKMVEEVKNTKILEILKQTDSFLREIGAKVKVQKGEIPDEQVDEDLKGTTNTLALSLKDTSKVYYNITHTKHEDILSQPTLLESGTLKSYQLIGLQWMVSLYNNKLNGILADEMGLGKTIQTIALFCYLMESKKNFGPFLIVVPLTTLSNWVLEFEKWAPSIKKIIYKGPPQSRKDLGQALKNTKWNVCVTTYEYILKDRLVLNKFHWQYIVVDEGHRMKNSGSKFAQTLGQQYQSEHRLLLTGTPLQNNLGELWSLLNFLLPKVFNSCDEFGKWFGMAVGKVASEKEGALSEEEQLLIINRLHQVLRPFLLRRVKKEVEKEIPNKVEYIVKVQLSSWQDIVYNQIQNQGSLAMDPFGRMGSKSLMNLMMQLRKICNHPYLFINNDYYTTNHGDMLFRVSGKFELLDRMLPKLLATKHKVLIFSQMVQLMDIMQLFFDYRGFKYLRLDGGTKADDRGERTRIFNEANSEIQIFFLSTRAGGQGLNLQAADTVIIFDSDWNPQMDLQAQDRAHRIGSKSEVRVFRLVTNTGIEEEIISKAAFKQNLDDILIQAGLYNERSTESERKEKLENLLRKKENGEEEENEIPDDEQINEWLARSDDEFTYFQQMDADRYEKEKLTYKHFQYPPKVEGQKFFNYRLIQEDEVPMWVKKVEVKKKDTGIQEYGKGFRTKKVVNYVDDMSDTQWLKMMEEGIGHPNANNNNTGNESSTTNVNTDKEETKQVGRPRRTRTRAAVQVETPSAKEEEKGTRRTLRRRTTVVKLQDLSEKEDDEDYENDNDDDSKNDEFDVDEEKDVDEKKYRRLKKTKRNNEPTRNQLDKKEENGDDKEDKNEASEAMQIEGEGERSSND
jgi:ATP-dependent helicase STH1/SNF2